MINDANSLDLEDFDNSQDHENELSSVEFNNDDNNSNSGEDDFNLTDELLATHGILDRDRIKFEDESGAVI